jgi:hypothetical protein
MLYAIATGAAALAAVNVQHGELADQIREDDCAVSGHYGQSRLKAPSITRITAGAFGFLFFI